MKRPECASADELRAACADGRLAVRLLEINLRRLEQCERLERERNIVYPEGSVILRDCERLRQVIAGKKDSELEW